MADHHDNDGGRLAARASRQRSDDGSSSSSSSLSSLSPDWISSPERYADVLGMSLDEVRRRKAEHEAASIASQKRIAAASLSGRDRHRLQCEHRFQRGKNPFVCPKCWCYLPICMCPDENDRKKAALPPSVEQVILWTHHREWGSVSNSGSLLPLVLENTQMLMKGLPRHDRELEEALSTASGPVVALWPREHDDDDATTEWPPADDDVDVDGPVTLLAFEGTWRTARRMVSKLPSRRARRVSLSADALSWHLRDRDRSSSSSLLRPLRRQKGTSVPPNNTSTAEAVAAALVAAGLPAADGRRVLDLVRTKVDRTRRYQGKCPREHEEEEKKNNDRNGRERE